MNRGVRQRKQQRYTKLTSFGLFSAVLALLPSTYTMAATADITQVTVTTAPQTIETNARSNQITLQLLNAAGEREALDTGVPGARVAVETTSSSGEFFNTATSTSAATDFSFRAGSATRSLHYRDAEPGIHTLSFRVYGGGLNQDVTATQTLTVTTPAGSQEPEPNPNPNPEPEPEPVPDPVLRLRAYTRPHVTKEVVVVFGTVQYMPDGAEVRAIIQNAAGERISSAVVTNRDTDIELARIALPETITSGAYTVELAARKDQTPVTDTVRTALNIELPAPKPDPAPTPVPEVPPTPAPKPVPIVPATPKIDPIQPIANLVLSTKFSTPLTLRSAASQSFIQATSRNGAMVRAATTARQQEVEKNKAVDVNDTAKQEQAITLKTSENDQNDAPAVAPSEEGWKVFGAPWYWWGGGTVAIYGAWLGVRRLLSGGE